MRQEIDQEQRPSPMLETFRKTLKSKIGAGIALLFLVLIAIAFASGDVANTGNFGGVAGGDRVATVGGERVDAAQLSQAASAAVERVKQEDPRASMKSFLAAGGLDNVLRDLIDRTAIAVFGKQNGVMASDRLVDSEISQIQGFRGPDGNFSQDAFRAALAQQGLNEKLVRDDLRRGLIIRQVLSPAAFGTVMPRELARNYASLLKDRRTGAVAVLPAEVFAPSENPTDAQLAAFYRSRSSAFIRPERRVIRFATFGEEALKAAPAPTDAEIAARYNQNKAQYVALETRDLTQLIVPTEAAAKAIVAEVSGGASLEAAARAKGLATARLDAQSKAAFAAQSTPEVADAAFAANRGMLAVPKRGKLGWHVIRVDAVNLRPARSLDQVKSELAQQIAAEKRRAAFTEMLERIESQFDEGSSLGDTAKELGLTIQQTEPITADGVVYGAPDRKAPAVLGRVIETAFAMERENAPQIAEVEAGKTFVIYDVSAIEPSAPAPFAQIREDVKALYLIDKGSAAARKAAEQVVAQVRKGTPLAQALASLKRPLPAPQQLNMNREQLAALRQQTQGRVPPTLALFFSMAEGTVKLLPVPGNRGWFVVSLTDIVPGEVKADDPLILAARRELGATLGGEYAEALQKAISAEVGVKKNETAIKAVRTQLGGDN